MGVGSAPCIITTDRVTQGIRWGKRGSTGRQGSGPFDTYTGLPGPGIQAESAIRSSEEERSRGELQSSE
jgi:hypothetical protein